MMQDSKDLLTQLKLIFDTIIRFCKTKKNLYDTAEHEAHQHKTYQQTIERKTAEVCDFLSYLYFDAAEFDE